MSDTMLDILRARASRICEEGVRLLRDFSGMHSANRPGDSVVLISLSGDQYWNGLPFEGKQIQTRLLPEVRRFRELLRVLTHNLPTTAQQDVATALEGIQSAIEQDGTTWWKTRNEAVEGFTVLIDQVQNKLTDYYASSSATALAVADTNALLGNPDIERWQFQGTGQFTVILTPTVLAELDRHKVHHRNQTVRDKASMLIRKIKEYRRRGSLHDGVAIVKNRIMLRTIAAEPDMSRSLAWFESTNADDRFLATTLDIIRGNLGAPVFIVTSDINMQNKAEMAGIPFREVPDERAEEEDG